MLSILGGAGPADDDDDDVPELVEDFETAANITGNWE